MRSKAATYWAGVFAWAFGLWGAIFHGLNAQAATLNISAAPLASVPGYELENAFGSLQFDQPVAILAPPGETNRLFVVERKGVIAVITNLANPTRSIFLDLTDVTESSYEEMGILGMAFHPGYATNGYFYIYRMRINLLLRDEITRFSVSASDPNRADRASEQILISQIDDNIHHNGGGLEFGPDGYLYCAIGYDGPWREERSIYVQDIDRGFFGAVIRIDVDKRPGNLSPNPWPASSSNYSIPADNPFIGATNFQWRAIDPAQVRTELYAIGLRQPFKLTFDSLTGELFIGDVGENVKEEINLIKKGANYGWPFMEGTGVHDQARPDLELEAPLIEIGHGHASNNVAAAVIGGIVCRNGNIPTLEGAYLFGDFVTGNIWKYMRDGNGEAVTWIARELGIAAFAQHPADGSVLIANAADGQIRRLVYKAPNESTLPRKLSQAGFFADLATLSPAARFQPYEINVPFWSDNATKRRWFAMPAGLAKIEFEAEENWKFPQGMMWVKHFDLEMTKGDPSTARRVETRALVKTEFGVEGYTYRWNAAGTDADLVESDGADQVFQITDGAAARAQIWHYPARGECQSCHTPAAGYALGFNTWQLNKTVARDGASVNQLQWMAGRGCLDRPEVEPESLRTLAAATDQSQPIEHRVKSFFAANCISCHQPNAPAFRERWDARITTPMSQSGILGKTILPMDLDNSNIYLRLSQFHPYFLHMPPLATELVNPEALALLSEYIGGLRSNDWKAAQIGTGAVLEGSIHRPTAQRHILGGAGAGVDDHFAYGVLLANNSQLIARVGTPAGLPAGALAGLEIRASPAAGSPGVWLGLRASGDLEFKYRAADGGTIETKPSAGNGFSWLRLVRQDALVTGYKSADGLNWQLAGRVTLSLPATINAGLMAASGNPWRYATAEFAELQTVSISLAVSNSSAVLPKTISFKTEIATNNAAVQRVDYFVGNALIGSSAAPPWRLDWTNATSGSYDAVAVAIDQNGLAIKSAPARLNFLSRPTEAAFLGTTANETGIWINNLGTIGHSLPALETNLPPGTLFAMADASATGALAAPLVPGLETATGNIVKSAWVNAGFLSFDLRLPTENAYRLTLYFAPYQNAIAEKVSLIGSEGELLAAQPVQDSGRGFFVSAIVRGPIQVRVESLNSFAATLSGIFLDPAPETSVSLTPSPNAVTLPASTLLQATVATPGRAVRKVEFWDGATLIGWATEPPYELLWTNIFAGHHQLTARALGTFALDASSMPVEFAASFPEATAIFLGKDATTLGNWPEAYGNGGLLIPGIADAMPPGAIYSLNGQLFIWDELRGAPSALANLNGSGSLPAVRFANWAEGIQMDLFLPDAKPQQVALYFIDSAAIKRSMLIRITDGLTKKLLLETPTEPVNEGVYFVYQIEGPAHIEIVPADNWEPVIGGLFLGGPVSPAQAWWLANFGKSLPGSAGFQEDPDHDGKPNLLEYALGTNPLVPEPGLGQLFSRADDGSTLVLRFPSARLADDAALYLESSTNLMDWETLDIPGTDEGDGNLEFRIPMGAGPRSYFRMGARLLQDE